MSDRVQTLTVTLDKEYRTDDIQPILDAIRCMKTVKSVKHGKILDPDNYVARQTVLSDFIRDLYSLLSFKNLDDGSWGEIEEALQRARKKRGY